MVSSQVARTQTTSSAANPSSGDIQIVSIVGADNLGAEGVILRYVGAGQVDLTNWQLKDEDGNLFLFPSITKCFYGYIQSNLVSVFETIGNCFCLIINFYLHSLDDMFFYPLCICGTGKSE